jgi:hypothetical protein
MSSGTDCNSESSNSEDLETQFFIPICKLSLLIAETVEIHIFFEKLQALSNMDVDLQKHAAVDF